LEEKTSERTLFVEKKHKNVYGRLHSLRRVTMPGRIDVLS